MPTSYRLVWLPKFDIVQPPTQQPMPQPVQPIVQQAEKGGGQWEQATPKQTNCCNHCLTLPFLLAMIPVAIFSAQLIRLATRGPRLVTAGDYSETTRKGRIVPGANCPKARIAIEPKFVTPCNNTYASRGLPPELEPEEYALKFTLKGVGSGIKIGGRVDIPLAPRADVERIVLRADPETLSGFKMALILEPTVPRTRKRIVDVLSATPVPGTDFLVVCVGETLVEGNSYTLAVEYEYRSLGNGTAPILIGEDTVRMDLKPLRAHEAFPCFEEDGWKARLSLTVLAPAGFTVVSNTPRKRTPVAVGALMSHEFEETPAMPLHKLGWVAFQSSTSEQALIPDAP